MARPWQNALLRAGYTPAEVEQIEDLIWKQVSETDETPAGIRAKVIARVHSTSEKLSVEQIGAFIRTL